MAKGGVAVKSGGSSAYVPGVDPLLILNLATGQAYNPNHMEDMARTASLDLWRAVKVLSKFGLSAEDMHNLLDVTMKGGKKMPDEKEEKGGGAKLEDEMTIIHMHIGAKRKVFVRWTDQGNVIRNDVIELRQYAGNGPTICVNGVGVATLESDVDRA